MTGVISFLRTIRKQPLGTRMFAFFVIVALVVPLTVYVWGVSLYREMLQISMNAGSQDIVAQNNLGTRLAAYSAQIAERTGQGFSYAWQALRSAWQNARVGVWIGDQVRILQGKPEILVPAQQESGAALPVASPVE